MHSLKEKIDILPPWFDGLKDPKSNISIHDVIYHDGETYVIWSDAKGYSVSHKAWNNKASGVSGIYPSLKKCLTYIPNYDE